MLEGMEMRFFIRSCCRNYEMFGYFILWLPDKRHIETYKVNNWAQRNQNCRFFILQYAKLRMLELHYNFFDKFCDVNNSEELEMDTHSLYLALIEEKLSDCICPAEKVTRKNWEKMIADIHLKQIQRRIFFHEHVAAFTRNTLSESLDYLKKNSGVRSCYCYVAWLTVAMRTNQIKWSLAAKDWKMSSRGMRRWNSSKLQENTQRSNRLDINKQRFKNY